MTTDDKEIVVIDWHIFEADMKDVLALDPALDTTKKPPPKEDR